MTEATKVATDQPGVDPLVEPLSLLATELTRIAAEIQAVECSHLERMEAAARELRDRLRDQVVAEVRQQLECEHRAETERLRADFEEQMRRATAQWEEERRSLRGELEDLRGPRAGRQVFETELAQTEKLLEDVRREIQTMLEDSNADLSQLMRKNARRSELETYLKGLTFKAKY